MRIHAVFSPLPKPMGISRLPQPAETKPLLFGSTGEATLSTPAKQKPKTWLGKLVGWVTGIFEGIMAFIICRMVERELNKQLKDLDGDTLLKPQAPPKAA